MPQSFKQFLKEENHFLTEAKISQANVEKALKLITKIISKKVGPLYRYGGKDGTQEYGRGVGYLYFTKTGKAIRFNYEKGDFVSASIWLRFKLGHKADFTVDFGGLNLIQIINYVTDIFLHPKAQTIGVYALDESIVIDEEILTEAKRISPEEFQDIVSRNLRPGESLQKIHSSRLSEIANANGVTIPGYVKKQHLGKGFHNAVAPDNPTQTDTKPVPQLYVKVTAQDPVTKKFISVADSKEAQQLTSQIQSMVKNPSTQEIKKEMKDPAALFGIMSDLTKLVIRKARNSLIIYGGPGIGKTFTVLETIKEAGLTKNQDWFHIKGKITNSSLYQALFMHRDEKLLVFDDADSVWSNEEAANILKAALDSYDERIISWSSARTTPVGLMSDEEKEAYNIRIDVALKSNPEDTKIKYPSEFEYKGRIIFISNLPYEKFDSAVLTRSAKIDMTLTPDQIFKRIENIIEYLGDPDVSKSVKIDILNFLKQKHSSGNLAEPSMRTFVAAVDLYKSGLENWKDLLDFI